LQIGEHGVMLGKEIRIFLYVGTFNYPEYSLFLLPLLFEVLFFCSVLKIRFLLL